jgi:hypothetical protein
MKLSELLTSLEDRVGETVTVEGVLHSDTVNVWVNDSPRTEAEQLVVLDPRVAERLLATIPPRIGGTIAYYFPCRIRGEVTFDTERKIGVMSNLDFLEIDHNHATLKIV